jgi:arginine repressor
MPPRSLIDQLPSEERQIIENLLINRNFSNYSEIAEALAEMGFEIKRSTLARFGKQFEERCNLLRDVTRQAEAIVKASPDDDNAINEALIRLAQEQTFNLLLKLSEAGTEINPEMISEINLAVNRLARISVQQKQWRSQVQEKLEKKFKQLETAAAEPKAALDLDTIRKIREQVYGIFTAG